MRDTMIMKLYNLERQIRCISPYINERLDTSTNDEERDFFCAVSFAMGEILRFIEEIKADKRLAAIDKAAHHEILKYVDAEVVIYNRDWYMKNKWDGPKTEPPAERTEGDDGTD